MRLRRKGSERLADVAARAEALEEALEAGGHRLNQDDARRARQLVAKLNERVRLSGDHTVVALAGATGSGKSSLFNALSGLDIATVGARRPTTSVAAACVWGVEGAEPLLEWLGVPRQHRVSHESALDSGVDRLRGLVLLDLPDFDSTELSHRLEVDRLVELVDVLVWVTDPQKYADALMHRQYLARLSGHDAVTVVVLNHADRLEHKALESCRRDLARLVAADGLPDADVLTTSAVTGDGVDALRDLLADAVGRRTAWNHRLAADLASVAGRLSTGVGEREAAADELIADGSLVDALLDAAGVPVVVRAVEADYVRGAVGAAGWPFTRWLRRFRPDPLRRLRLGVGAGGSVASGLDRPGAGAGVPEEPLRRSSLPAPSAGQRGRVEMATRRLADRAAVGLPASWADAVRAAAQPPADDLHDALDQAVVAADVRSARPVWWRGVGGLQWALAVCAVVGLVWLVVLAVMGGLRLPEPRTPYVGPIPWPTLLLVAGLVLGALVGVAVRAVAGPLSRARGHAARDDLAAAVDAVARQRIVGPVLSVLDDHRATREALERVRG